MRFFVSLLSIYLLALSALPCNDTDFQVQHEQDQALKMTAQDNHQETPLDFCSPFCVCHCCHWHAINDAKDYQDIANNVIPSNIFSYKENYEQKISNFHFQPPRA